MGKYDDLIWEKRCAGRTYKQYRKLEKQKNAKERRERRVRLIEEKRERDLHKENYDFTYRVQEEIICPWSDIAPSWDY